MAPKLTYSSTFTYFYPLHAVLITKPYLHYLFTLVALFSFMGPVILFTAFSQLLITLTPSSSPNLRASSAVCFHGLCTLIIKVAVYKDFKNGNWFLLVKDEVVGFWPSQIFVGGLADSGSYIACGGEVFIPTRRYLLPEMGAGYNPVKKLEDNAYCSWFNVVNENDVIVNADDTEEYANDPDTYKVWDRGYTGGDHGHLVLYGGGLR
uniref:Neprosin PEP catalytic domain-containing protein n=1 Tax=Opuntia streptacantha TaxID=393608 RepID=A0A7C8ZC94_OPUST